MSKTEFAAKAPEKGECVSYEILRVATRPDGTVDHERTALLDPSSAWDDEYATLHGLAGLVENTGGSAADAADWVDEVADTLAHLEDDFGPTLRRIVGVDAE